MPKSHSLVPFCSPWSRAVTPAPWAKESILLVPVYFPRGSLGQAPCESHSVLGLPGALALFFSIPFWENMTSQSFQWGEEEERAHGIRESKTFLLFAGEPWLTSATSPGGVDAVGVETRVPLTPLAAFALEQLREPLLFPSLPVTMPPSMCAES